MEEEHITHQQRLALIESMINKAKNQFSENGFAYLLWGWVILFCSLSQFILQYLLHYPKHYLVWGLTWVAVIIQLVNSSKKGRKKRVKTYTDGIIGYVWLAFVIMMLLTGLMAAALLRPEQVYIGNIIILILYGMPTLLSGIILQFNPLVRGGIGCWILAVTAVFIPHNYVILLIAAAVIIAWIIPGYLLRSKYKKEHLLSVN